MSLAGSDQSLSASILHLADVSQMAVGRLKVGHVSNSPFPATGFQGTVNYLRM